jgi:hypothetical protein
MPLVVTNTGSVPIRYLEWGLEGPLTYDPDTELLIDSEDLVTSGFAGAPATITGGYDPPSSGADTAVGGLVYTAPQAICGLGDLEHVGTFLVKARVMSNVSGMQTRLSWRAGDGPLTSNQWVSPHIYDLTGSFSTWCEINLGTVIIPRATSGDQRWTGQIEAFTPSGGELYVDFVTLVPISAGYGKARAFAADTAQRPRRLHEHHRWRDPERAHSTRRRLLGDLRRHHRFLVRGHVRWGAGFTRDERRRVRPFRCARQHQLHGHAG